MRRKSNVENEFKSKKLEPNLRARTKQKKQRLNRLKTKRDRDQSSRRNETEEHRLQRIEKVRERKQSQRRNETEEQRLQRLRTESGRRQSRRRNETEEQRLQRLRTDNERKQSQRRNETEEQRLQRLRTDNERLQSQRRNETEEQRLQRLRTDNERKQSQRRNETEEQRLIRLAEQKTRSQANRTKKKSDTHVCNSDHDLQTDIVAQYVETDQDGSLIDGITHDITHKGAVSAQERNSARVSWPKSISRELKETRLRNFLQQMSMSALAEETCAVCNIRTSVKKLKRIPISNIPDIHLLKVSTELKELIRSPHTSNAQHSDENIGLSVNNIDKQLAGHVSSNCS